MISNKKINTDDFLPEMYEDDYFPDFLVDKCRDILANMCEIIEEKSPKTLEELYEITQAATEEINYLEEEFDENNSELETVARDCLATEFWNIALAYGFNPDLEELIANRDW